MRRTVKYILSVLTAIVVAGSLYGCNSDDAKQISEIEKLEDNGDDVIVEEPDEEEEKEADNEAVSEDDSTEKQTAQAASGAEAESSLNQAAESASGKAGESGAAQTDAGSNLDQIDPDPADDNWYMKGNVYTSNDGHYAEVFFDDEGMLEFAVDGLSMYYSHVDKVEYENNWRIYACDDGTTVIYYPGEPAHLEIYSGDDPKLYEEGGDKVK